MVIRRVAQQAFGKRITYASSRCGSNGLFGISWARSWARKVGSDKLQRRKTSQVTGQMPLRKVALAAEKTRLVNHGDYDESQPARTLSKKVMAYCAAEQYDMKAVSQALQRAGFHVDPLSTGLYPQVLHAWPPKDQLDLGELDEAPAQADLIVFSSGTVVTWNVPQPCMLHVLREVLQDAAINFHCQYTEVEQEDLDFFEDASKIRSEIIGETVVIGTSAGSASSAPKSGFQAARVREDSHMQSQLSTILVKIAFSSGIARSTKLAMLERLTESYIASTRSIPLIMSKGISALGRPSMYRRICDSAGLTSRLPFSRSFILQKTGELLAIRAQLNLYSELTDSLPDLFWDSKHELRLENYYDMVGRALDVGVRIKVLNEKMDYAQEIASTLREALSERHNLRLEWGIIVLIAIEVLFEMDQRWRRPD